MLAVNRNKARLKTSVSTFHFLREHQLLKPHDDGGNDGDVDDDYGNKDTWNTWSLHLFAPACS